MNPIDAPMSVGELPFVSPWPTILKYGLIGSGLIFVINLVSVLTTVQGGFTPESITANLLMGLVMIVAFVLIMIFAVKEYRDKKNQGYVTFGNGVLISFGSSVIVGISSMLFSLIYFLIIDPDYMTRMLTKQYEEMGMDIPPGMDDITTGMVIGVQVGSFIVGMLLGIILALIISAVMRKDRSVYA